MTKLTGNERTIAVTALKHAAPYIRMYKRKVFVLKAGGEAFYSAESTERLVEQIGILHQVGIRLVVVHGGGPQSTALASKLGIQSEFVDGRRVTMEAVVTDPVEQVGQRSPDRRVVLVVATDDPARLHERQELDHVGVHLVVGVLGIDEQPVEAALRQHLDDLQAVHGHYSANQQIAAAHAVIVTVEENALQGGAGSAVNEVLEACAAPTNATTGRAAFARTASTSTNSPTTARTPHATTEAAGFPAAARAASPRFSMTIAPATKPNNETLRQASIDRNR